MFEQVRALRKQTLERRSSEVEARGRVQSDTGATAKKDVGRKSREMAVAVALSFRMYGGCKLYCRLQSWVIW